MNVCLALLLCLSPFIFSSLSIYMAAFSLINITTLSAARGQKKRSLNTSSKLSLQSIPSLEVSLSEEDEQVHINLLA